ncbi:hypothetical protein FB451DRAFT_1372630 [Mycena latifolia]|nr:hypothetical protein FB451DRAFT_1372630 [Mycena latifolia]
MSYYVPAAPATVRSGENDASDSSSVFDPDAEHLVCAHATSLTRVNDARAARDAAACSVVEGLLSHYPAFKLTMGPTVPAALQNALLPTSFYSLAQELEDASAPSGMIIDFRRQWRCFHGLPEASHSPAKFPEALAQPTFGAAAALFVDKLHVSDIELGALIIVWRSNHGEPVSERGTFANTFSLTAQLTLSRGQQYGFNFGSNAPLHPFLTRLAPF